LDWLTLYDPSGLVEEWGVSRRRLGRWQLAGPLPDSVWNSRGFRDRRSNAEAMPCSRRADDLFWLVWINKANRAIRFCTTWEEFKTDTDALAENTTLNGIFGGLANRSRRPEASRSV